MAKYEIEIVRIEDNSKEKVKGNRTIIKQKKSKKDQINFLIL